MTAVTKTIARGDNDMFVGFARDFPLVLDWLQMLDIPVIVTNDMILLKFKPPRRARDANGASVPVVSYHDGRYYSAQGNTYRSKDLIWE